MGTISFHLKKVRGISSSFSVTSNNIFGNLKKNNKINFREILDNLPVPITVWNLVNNDFLLKYLNKEAETFAPGLTEGRNLSVVLPQEYEKIFLKNGREPSNIKLINDENLIVILKTNPFENNPALHMYSFKNELFKTIVDQSPLSIVITDTQGRIEHVNPIFTEITGYALKEVIGKNPCILSSGQHSSKEYEKLWKTILSGQVWKGEFTNKRKNGELFYECGVISPVKDNSGIITNFISIREDVTQLKKTGEELKKNEKLAALGRMAAFISHEIKTPLSSIRMNIDILEKKMPDPDSKKSFFIIQKEIRRLTNLLKEILQYTNYTPFTFSNIDLYKKIENIKLFLEPLLIEKKIKLHNKTSECYLFGNAQKLRSMFIHLIQNSIESITSGGEITISSEERDNNCYIYIKDNGCGLDNPEHIFEPFVSSKSSGSGFGLAIVKNIADIHKGSISLISSIPGETIFEIILPMGIRVGKDTNS